ncbi:MAG: amidophosphoribosyltransferase [bacterium]|nr:amidophosphoribosyltransferase [bacterium]
MPDGGLKDHCGVFGIAFHPEAAGITHHALYALQHRGQESAGIVASGEGGLEVHKGMGLVADVFDRSTLARLGQGTDLAVGHVRYSTYGASALANAQPLLVRYRSGPLALAHNGNLVNAAAVREELEGEGSIFQTSLDTEVVAHLVARLSDDGPEEALAASLARVRGGYALLALAGRKLIGVRDPNGIRPLALGRLGDAYLLASESCAFDAAGAEFVREVEPGEMVVVDRHGLRSTPALPPGRPAFCVFEFIYIARPDSDLQGMNVHAVRKELGRRLARNYPVEADIVTGVPDSSISAASGYAEEARIPYEMGLVKNRYIGRTFIQPHQEARDLGVTLKLNPLRKVIDGQRVVLVDDSIVRGTTSRHIVRLLREAGAREVHLRIASPPYRWPCYFGIDTSSRGELVAAVRDGEEVRRLVGADSLKHLSLEELVAGTGAGGCCLACFNGDYPVPVEGGGRLG